MSPDYSSILKRTFNCGPMCIEVFGTLSGYSTLVGIYPQEKDHRYGFTGIFILSNSGPVSDGSSPGSASMDPIPCPTPFVFLPLYIFWHSYLHEYTPHHNFTTNSLMHQRFANAAVPTKSPY